MLTSKTRDNRKTRPMKFRPLPRHLPAPPQRTGPVFSPGINTPKDKSKLYCRYSARYRLPLTLRATPITATPTAPSSESQASFAHINLHHHHLFCTCSTGDKVLTQCVPSREAPLPNVHPLPNLGCQVREGLRATLRPAPDRTWRFRYGAARNTFSTHLTVRNVRRQSHSLCRSLTCRRKPFRTQEMRVVRFTFQLSVIARTDHGIGLNPAVHRSGANTSTDLTLSQITKCLRHLP